MKTTRLIFTALICAAAMMLSGIIAHAGPSTWAQDAIETAVAQDLVPQQLRGNYTEVITRAEFCALAVRLHEATAGEITGRVSFIDTDDENVEKMAYLGVVNGVGGNRFDPYGPITREQAAVMLARLADVIGQPLPEEDAEFDDNAYVAPWAVESVGRVRAAGIMTGFDEYRFGPQEPYTIEQSIVTIQRMYEFATQVDPYYYERGRVWVVSNGIEYEPHVHFMHGVVSIAGMPMSGSGVPFSFENVVADLPVIAVTDDFRVVISGADATNVHYSLYDADFENIYRGADELQLPDEAGVYMLFVYVTWTAGDYVDGSLIFTMNRYVFQIAVEE